MTNYTDAEEIDCIWNISLTSNKILNRQVLVPMLSVTDTISIPSVTEVIVDSVIVLHDVDWNTLM